MITARTIPTPIRPRCEEMMIGGLMALQTGVRQVVVCGDVGITVVS